MNISSLNIVSYVFIGITAVALSVITILADDGDTNTNTNTTIENTIIPQTGGKKRKSIKH